jgi:Sulfotransferase domain
MRSGQVLVLWSAPRSRSTAFFRMMTERGDFTAVHEPFSYLAEFGYAELAGTRVTSAPALLDGLRRLAARRPVFVKETTGKRYPEVLGDEEFMARDAVHTFLIRHPRETIASRHPLDPGAGIGKAGFESLFEIFTEAARRGGQDPVVIDAADLMASPAAIVRAYCERVGIAFLPQALTWSPQDRPEWTLSSRWHAEAAASTGFAPAPAAESDPGVDVERDPVLSRYLAHHLPFYADLHARRLTA